MPSNAPISSNVTSGIVANPSRRPVGCTCFVPFMKSSLQNVILSTIFYSTILFVAINPASLIKLVRSLATYPLVFFASSPIRSSFSGIGKEFKSFSRISSLSGSSGMLIVNSRSNLPERRNYVERFSGLLVLVKGLYSLEKTNFFLRSNYKDC